MLAKAVQVAGGNYAASLGRLPDAPPGMPRIAALIRHHGGIVDTQGSRALNILVAEASLRPEIHEFVSRWTDQGLQRLCHELQSGIAAGTIVPTVAVEPVARMIFAFLRGQMSFSIIDDKHDPHAVAEAFIATLEATISVSKIDLPNTITSP